MNKYPRIFFLIIPSIVFGIFACRTEVQQAFPRYEQTPVINAVFTADSTMWVHVSFAQSMGNEPITTIPNAQVLVFCQNSCIDTLTHSGNGLYVSDSVARQGVQYTIRAVVPNYDTITATQLIPFTSHVIRSEFIPIVTHNSEGHVSGFDVTIKTTPKQLSYYMIYCFGYSYGNYRQINTSFSEDDPSFIHEGIPSGVISNALYLNDSTLKVRLVYQQGIYYDAYQLYQIQVYHISKDFYEYMRSSYLYEKNRYPEFSFNGIAPYNLYSNTSNNHGVFMSSSVSITDTVRIYNNPSLF